MAPPTKQVTSRQDFLDYILKTDVIISAQSNAFIQSYFPVVKNPVAGFMAPGATSTQPVFLNGDSYLIAFAAMGQRDTATATNIDYEISLSSPSGNLIFQLPVLAAAIFSNTLGTFTYFPKPIRLRATERISVNINNISAFNIRVDTIFLALTDIRGNVG